MLKNHSEALAKALSALTLISSSCRSDGTYNRDRRACEQLARQTLREIDQLTGMGPVDEALAEADLPANDLPPAKVPRGVVTVPDMPEPPPGERNALHFLSANPRVVAGDTFVINSDGACKGNPGPSSWGVTVERNGELVLAESGFLGMQTNQVAELMAALEGLRRVPPGAKVVLFSDSQYTLNGLSSWRKGWQRNGWRTADNKPVKNKEIWVALAAEADKRQVETRWVRGHSGDPMNELCDQLANEAVAKRGSVVRC